MKRYSIIQGDGAFVLVEDCAGLLVKFVDVEEALKSAANSAGEAPHPTGQSAPCKECSSMGKMNMGWSYCPYCGRCL